MGGILMIKLIMSDMDGTLLSSNGEICERNLEAIHYAKENGVSFGIATGRDFRSMKQITAAYNLVIDFALLSNGAEFTDSSGKLLLSNYMEKAAFIPVTEVLEKYQLPYLIYTTNGVFSPTPDKTRQAFILRACQKFGGSIQDFQEGGFWNDMPIMRLQALENKVDFLDKDLEILKIESFHIETNHIIAAKNDLEKFEIISCLSSLEDNLEITDSKAQKGYILERALPLLGFSKDEVLVIGDGMNDLSMFELFPYSFAPNNAQQMIKKRAYSVVSNNETGAVADAIYNMLSF